MFEACAGSCKRDGCLRREAGVEDDGIQVDTTEQIPRKKETTISDEEVQRAQSFRRKGDDAVERCEWDDAVIAYGNALSIDARMPEALNGRSLARLRKGDVTEALNDANEALKLDPKLISAILNRAEIRLRIGNFTEAISGYDCKLALSPINSRALCGRGEARFMTDDLEGALLDLDMAARQGYPGAAELLSKVQKASD